MRGSVSKSCSPLGWPWGRGDAGTQHGSWQDGSSKQKSISAFFFFSPFSPFPPPPLVFFSFFGDGVHCTLQKVQKEKREKKDGRGAEGAAKDVAGMQAGGGCGTEAEWFVQHRKEAVSELLFPSQRAPALCSAALLPEQGWSSAPSGAPK